MWHVLRTRSSATPDRRARFVVVLALLGASLAGPVAAGELQVVTASHIDAARLQANLEHLSEIGRDPAGGIPRDLDAAKMEHMRERTQQRFADIDREEGTATVCTEVNHIEPALGDPGIQATIRAAARSAGLGTMDLPSGAVHDAGEISRLAPMGMIFVPSHAGISHAPQEFTPPGDVANGVEILYRTILLLDKKLGSK
jgi:acetylornithine deacetylase/succinyl-diaminopimelate desuccinylase-like protein